MNLSVTSILSRLALEQDDKLAELLNAAVSEGKKSGDPLAVRFKPGVRDFITLMSPKLGISASEFINILIEGVIRETLAPYQVQATHVLERFQLLMDAHELRITDIATLLSPWNIGLSVLENRERTMDYLSGPLLSVIADWFCVSEGWLKGEITSPVDYRYMPTGWLNVENILNEQILITIPASTSAVKVILFRDDLFPPVDMMSAETTVGVSMLINKEVNGIKFTSMNYLGEHNLQDTKSHSVKNFIQFCYQQEKEGKIHLMTRVVSSSLHAALTQGKVLPRMTMNKLLASQKWQAEELAIIF